MKIRLNQIIIAISIALFALFFFLLTFASSILQLSMKKIGFLSFGHWSDHPSYGTRTAGDTLLQSIDLAVAAEEIGMDGAYFRVHHFTRQLASPFPLLSAIGAKTTKIEIGTGVIDMRYENLLYMVKDGTCYHVRNKRKCSYDDL